MSIDRAVMAFAGFMILASLVLSQIHSPYWLWFTAFVGANLLQFGFTNLCPLGFFLRKLGVPDSKASSCG